MAVDTKRVYVGTPDQATTGAILTAPLGTTAPTSASAALTGFADSGYVSEDGLKVSPDYSTTDIKEWSGATVRTILESFEGTIEFGLIQLDYAGACQAFGDDYVTRTAATLSSGELLAISIGNHLPDAKVWVFNMKDGDKRIRIVVPNGQVTAVDEMDFTSSDAVTLNVTVSCYDDGTGNSIYIYTDDGVKASA